MAHRMLLSLILISSLHQLMFLSVVDSCSEFLAAGDHIGWAVPPSNDTNLYNDWASEKRFKVGDCILFKYSKDSVMEVNETDYRRCNSTRPVFFSNTGKTVVSFNSSGYFYFISGASGHCDKGQRMIVKVMARHQDAPSSSSSPPAKYMRPVFTTFVHFFLVFCLLQSYYSGPL